MRTLMLRPLILILAGTATGEALAHELVLDRQLAAVAEAHLLQILEAPGDAHLDEVMTEMARQGMGDAQVLPFAVFGTSLSELEQKHGVFHHQHGKARGYTHFGIATKQNPRTKEYGLVALYSRRLVSTVPLPAVVKTQSLTVRLRPSVAHKLKDEDIRGYLATPKGKIETFGIQRNWITGEPTFQLFFRDGPGQYVFEIMANGPRGPEASLIWRITQGTRPLPPREAPEKLKLPDNRTTLRALLVRNRTQAGLLDLKDDPRLNKAAQKHADAVCEQRLAAHILPEGHSAAQRVRAFGFEGRIAENVAMAQTVGRAHENLYESPSHRANILDPTMSLLGLGLTSIGSKASSSRYDHRPSRTWCVVQLFGAPR